MRGMYSVLTIIHDGDDHDHDPCWPNSAHPSPAILTRPLCSDEYCPNCDNHFVIDALTPKAALKVESEDTRMDARYVGIFLANGAGD